MKRKKMIVPVIICFLATVAIFQDRYPIPGLLAIAKIEMKLASVVKIDNSPVRYLVKMDRYRGSDNDVKIVQAEGGSEWMQDLIIDGNRYPADWTIYLGRYRVYIIKTTSIYTR